MKNLIRNISLGIFLPITVWWFDIRFIVWILEPKHSLINSIYVYVIVLLLVSLSFIGGYLLARTEKIRKYWVRFTFAILASVLFLPVFVIICPIGALFIWIFYKLKYPKVVCLIVSIISLTAMTALMIFVTEKGNIDVVKKSKSAVIVMNHRGSADYFLASWIAFSKNWRAMIGKNLFKIWGFKWFFSAVGFPIERENNATNKRGTTVQKAKDFLIENRDSFVIIFPEATRNRTNKPSLDFKYGAFNIACELGLDIILVVASGSEKWRFPSEQDITSYVKKKQNIRSIFNKFKSYLIQFFKQGINPSIIKLIYLDPISTVGKSSKEVMLEVRRKNDEYYLRYSKKAE